MVARSPVAHNLFSYDLCHLQTVPGGHIGLPPALACGMVMENASTTAAASISKVFFTADSLVEVGISP
jgi:hypothetical protein